MPVNISLAALVGGMQVNFNYFGAGVSSGALFDTKIAGAGTDSICYKYTASNNCIDSVYEPVVVIVSPAVNAGPDLYVLANQSAIIKATASGADLNYKWSPATFLNSDSVFKPVGTPACDTYYTLTVAGEGGCVNSSSMLVKILPNPLIPNAFSPNGGGLNETWGIKFINLYPDCDVKIFDRFEQLIFHSIGYKQPWDGTFKGQLMRIGIYRYLIDTKKQKNIFKGTEALIR
jgi:gliding motility-associated-like protein